jgi:hypothetical protein
MERDAQAVTVPAFSAKGERWNGTIGRPGLSLAVQHRIHLRGAAWGGGLGSSAGYLAFNGRSKPR